MYEIRKGRCKCAADLLRSAGNLHERYHHVPASDWPLTDPTDLSYAQDHIFCAPNRCASVRC
jgi:hypothetical protein